MMEGLLLDWVDAKTTGPAVSRKHDSPILPGPDEAEAALPLMQFAKTRAEVALNASVVKRLPVFRCNGRTNHL
jgi:hypothetical protein